ncbi:MAG: sigma-70 family RNA polymerase sigma factor, partial [Pseudoflavonifractor sp.]
MKLDSTMFNQFTDEALCAQAILGNRVAEEQLVLRYNRLVRICARPYFLAGGDSEDLIQEGMVGLLSAIRVYDPARDTSFHTYAEVCIKNRLLSAVRAATRGKHMPLNNYVSFETPSFDGNTDRYVLDAVRSHEEDPEAIMIGREELRERMDVLKGQLSGFEAKILRLYLNGLSYSDIAAEITR